MATRRSVLLRGIGAAGSALTGAGLAACAGVSGSATAPPAPQAGPVTLELAHRWDGPAREPIVQEQLQKFQAKYPRLTVKPVMYHQAGETGPMQAARFFAAIAAGTPPRRLHDPFGRWHWHGGTQRADLP